MPRATAVQRPSSSTPRFSLVLGAGGMVGIAYHAGVLRALRDRFGIDPNEAELIVGTSAGSVMGAYLRSGWSVDELWELAIGTHPSLEGLGADPDSRRSSMALKPSFGDLGGFSRRAVGSWWVAWRSLVPLPMPKIPQSVQRLFRAGLFSTSEAKDRFTSDLGSRWPDRALALCAYDIASGRRAVFSASSSRPVSLVDAVLASCSIPGFYPPVSVEGRLYVDGGVHSSTNLDLAARHRGDLVIVVAPMDFEPGAVLDPVARLMRNLPHQRLRTELATALRRGVQVATIRPSTPELAKHGLNLMRSSGGLAIAELAYETTMEREDLEEPLGAFRAKRPLRLAKA